MQETISREVKMNIIKKATLFGSVACMGITLYAALGTSAGQTKAANLASEDMTNLTESAQNMSNLEMSINNLLIATNRINFINDNIISVGRDYTFSLRGLQNENMTQTEQNVLNQGQTEQNSIVYDGQFARNNGDVRRMPPAPNVLNMELSRLNTNAQNVRDMLYSINLETARGTNFADITKTLNMAADNLNSFSDLALNQNAKDYPNARRLAFASVRISNNALEQIKRETNRNETTVNSNASNQTNTTNETATLNSTVSSSNVTNQSLNNASLNRNNGQNQTNNSSMPTISNGRIPDASITNYDR